MPMVDVLVRPTAARADDVVELVRKPLEGILQRASTASSTIYTYSYDDRVMAAARFRVGTKSDEAILRVHELRASFSRIPLSI